MELIRALIEFFKVGLFTYGGGLAMLPLFQDLAIRNNWITHEMFVNMIAISQSTPGPIAINPATFVGFNRFGFIGAVLASIAVVLPGSLLSVVTSHFLTKFKESKFIKMLMELFKTVSIGMLIAAVYGIGKVTLFKQISDSKGVLAIIFDLKSIIIFSVCLGMNAYLKDRPVLIILMGGIIGLLLF